MGWGKRGERCVWVGERGMRGVCGVRERDKEYVGEVEKNEGCVGGREGGGARVGGV